MGFIAKAVKGIVKVVAKAVKLVGGIFGFLVGGKKKKPTSNVNNLTKSLEPEAARKIAFGRIAAPLDLRFWEVYGTSGQFYDEVVAHATHRINAYKELYMDDKLAIDASGVVQTTFVGVLTRNTRFGIPGQTALSAGSGSLWTATSKFTGCAYSVLTWQPDEKKLPNGIPNRYTQIIEGAFVYDPRRDSTQPGGSGTHRINDQSTWAYATLDSNGVPIGRNNALQALWYLIGWRIQNPTTGEWVLVAGRGVDPTDINITSFIAGANNCEIAGYYTDLVLSTEDAHTSNEDKITCNGLIARLIDPGGLWSYYANVNDTANVAVTLTDDDVLDQGSVSWVPARGLSEQFNQVVGKFINPSSVTLFQPFPYPMVRDAVYEANLGIKRRATQDFEQILDSTLAQRLARLKLNENQYQGEFQSVWGPRAIKAQAFSVVRFISARFGWNKLFRVWRHEIKDGQVTMLLREIDPSIWSAGTVASALSPSTGVGYDPTTQITATNVTITLTPMVGANGDKADGFTIAWSAPPTTVRRSEVRYRLVGTTNWLAAGPVSRDTTSVVVGPLLSGAIYEAQVRHISMHEVPGPWVYSTLSPANSFGQFQLAATGTINYAAISAAGGTAIWSNITGAGRPTDNADVTASNYSAGVSGGGPWIFEQTATAALIKPQANLIYDAGLKLSGRNWVLNGWGVNYGSDVGYFAGAIAGNPTMQMGSRINIFSSTQYTFSCFNGGLNYTLAGGGVFQINWYNASDVFISQNVVALTATGAGYLRSVGTFTSPATAVYCRLFVQAPTLNVGGGFLIFKPKFEMGGIASAWNDESTFSARYENGQVIDVLRPAEASADITGTHNSGGVTGAGDLLFLNKAQLPIGSNNLLNADFSRGFYGYRTKTVTGVSGLTAIVGINLNTTYGGKRNVAYGNVPTSGAPWAASTFDFLDVAVTRGFWGTPNDGATYQKTFGLQVKQGDRVYGRCLAAQHRCQFQLYLVFHDKDGNSTENAGPFTGAADFGFSNGGDPALANIVSGIYTVTNANSVACSLLFRMKANDGADPFVFFSDAAFGILPAGQTTLPAWQPGPPSRILDPTQYNTQNLLGPANVTNLAPTYTVGGSNVTVNLPAHDRIIAGINGPITLHYGACSAVWPFSSYWTGYVDDADLTGIASPALVLTGDPTQLLYPNRYQIASGLTPSSAGTGGDTSGGGGGGGGSGGGWEFCVEIYSYMPTGEFAYQLEPGDDLIVLNEDNYNDTTRRKVTKNSVEKAECVKITSESGIQLVLSKVTPCTLKGGATVKAEEIYGRDLAVLDGAGFRWEQIVAVEDVGIQDVAHISCKDGTYAAGLEDGRYIFTHNIVHKP